MEGVADKNINENCEQIMLNEVENNNLSECSQENGNHELGGRVLECAQINKTIETGNAPMNEKSTYDGITDSKLVDKLDGLMPSLSCSQSNKQEVPMSVHLDDELYRMDHKNRGHAVIFNHNTFAPELNSSAREGTEKDVECLQVELKKLKFEVKVYNDLKVEILRNKVKKWSKKDHSQNDCFLMVVLTHGGIGNKEGIEELLAQDSKYRICELWRPFTADRCPSLAGKPKLFFFQACRGNKYDNGVTLKHQVDSFSNSEETSELQTDCPTYSLPSTADFLFAYATIPGYFAWKSASGSWFIQSLCAVLSEYGSSLEINDIFIKVKHRVAVRYESNNTGQFETDGKKEVPAIDSRLIRRLVFSPKTDDDSNNVSH